jgi:pSer/pThr/pTyr-binding forkhead associated (FHA) protein
MIQLPSRGMTLGRDAACDCLLEDDAVSRCHGKISLTPEGWEFRDLRSRNGSYLNHARTERAILHHGDHIRMGRIIFRFEDPQPASLHSLLNPVAEPSTRKRRRSLAVVAAVLLAIAATVGWWSSKAPRKAADSGMRRPSQSSPERNPGGQPEASSPLAGESTEAKVENSPAAPQDSPAAMPDPATASCHITIFAQVSARFAPPYQGADQEWPSEQELHLELEGLPIQGSQGLCRGWRKVPGATDQVTFNQEGRRITNLRWIATRKVARTLEGGREEPMREERWELELARLDHQASAKSDMFLWLPGIGPEPKFAHAVRFLPGNASSNLVQAFWSRGGKGSLEASVQINRLR